MAFDQGKYIVSFMKQNYFEFSLYLPKGMRETLKTAAKERSLSVGDLTRMALEEVYGLQFDQEDIDEQK